MKTKSTPKKNLLYRPGQTLPWSGMVTPIIGSLRLFATYLLSKIALREPFPDEETPTEQAGFFSQVLFEKQSSVPPQTKRK